MLGANRVIDYTKEDFFAGKVKYDLIVAVNGNYSLLKCKRALKPDGRYVMVGGALSQVFRAIVLGKPLSMGRKKMLFLAAKPNTDDLKYIMHLASDGIIRPVIERYYSPDAILSLVCPARDPPLHISLPQVSFPAGSIFQ